MFEITEAMKLLSDKSRLRILMLLKGRELCVCQIMGVLGMSQPLVSRNLSLLSKAGFLDDRREGKMIFYTVRKSPERLQRLLLGVVADALSKDPAVSEDERSLGECREFQKRTGKCGMETYLAYMEKRAAKARKMPRR
ncbi:MAG TPA: metalloregulator ArsR/SmtB family transcription factor [Dissulfurispiraceae bacterium]|nr:metalloregulator ArsR/SmtB family transcription factor [Dissulfurispiraceae bacterium]